MKACKECKIFIESGEYCFDCGLKLAAKIAADAGITVEELTSALSVFAKKTKKMKNKLGNPKQDKEILKFLREKRKKEDIKYNYSGLK